ncbi:MAG: DUF5615 family PIN-like protein [Vicinamibacterales bacterium]
MAAIKLDENVPDSVAAIFRDAGHDVALARDQQLAGAAHEQLLAIAAGEHRTLVTLDRDFTNILRHPPDTAAGIVVLRPQLQTLSAIRRLAHVVSEHLTTESPSRRLWVIDESKIRIWPRGPA